MASQQMNVELRFNANIEQARKQIRNLQADLEKLQKTNSLTSNNPELGITKELIQASAEVSKLQSLLGKSIDVSGKLNLSSFSKGMKESGMTIDSIRTSLNALGPDGTKTFNNLAKSIISSTSELQKSKTVLSDFGTTLKNTVKWQISSSMIHGFMGAIQGAYSYAQDLNESLNNIRIVTGQSEESMTKFAKQANEAAKALSSTTTAYTNAALIFYQQGLNDDQVKERTDTVIKMSNVTGQSAEEVSSYMTAIWNNFDDGSESLEHFADVITSLGATTASSSAEISEGLEKFAAIGKTVGLSYDYATSALATVVANTRQSADIVGTAFKTIFSRLQGLQLGETLEDGVDLNKYSKALDAVGIKILDTAGNMRDLDDILDDLAAKWDTLSSAQQTALAQTVAGTRQYSQLIALMNNWDDMVTNLATARSSSGALQEQADIYAESWEAARKRVKASLQDIYTQLIDDKAFIKTTDNISKIVDTIGDLLESIGGLKTLIPIIGTIMLKAFGPELKSSLSQIKDQFDFMVGKTQKVALSTRAQFIQGMRSNALASGNIMEQYKFDAMEKGLQIEDAILNKQKELNKLGREFSDQEMMIIGHLREQNEEYQKQYIEKIKINEISTVKEQSLIKDFARNANDYSVTKNKTFDESSFKSSAQDVSILSKNMAAAEAVVNKYALAVSELTDENMPKFRKELMLNIESLDEQGITFSNTAQTIINDMLQEGISADDFRAKLDELEGTYKNGGQDIQEYELKLKILKDLFIDAGYEVSIATENTRELDEQFQQGKISLTEFSSAVMDLATHSKNGADAIGEFSNKIEPFEKFSSYASSASMFAASLSSLSHIADTLNNPDMSDWDKFLSILTSAGMAIPMMITSINNLSKAMGVETSLLEVYTTWKDKEKSIRLSSIAISKAEATTSSSMIKNTAKEIIARFANSEATDLEAFATQELNALKAQGIVIDEEATDAIIAETMALEGQTTAQNALNKSILANPYVLIGAAVLAVILGITKAIDSLKQNELDEKNVALEASNEKLNNKKEEISANEDVIKSYEELNKQYKNNEIALSDYRTQAIEICDQLDLQAEKVRILAGEYVNLTDAINNNKITQNNELIDLNQEKQSNAESQMIAAMSKGTSFGQTARKLFLPSYGSILRGLTPGAVGGLVDPARWAALDANSTYIGSSLNTFANTDIYDFAKDKLGDYFVGSGANSGFTINNVKTAEDAYTVYKAINEILKENAKYADTESYKELKTIYDNLEPGAQAYAETLDEINELTLDNTLLEEQNNLLNIKNYEEYVKKRQELIDNSNFENKENAEKQVDDFLKSLDYKYGDFYNQFNIEDTISKHFNTDPELFKNLTEEEKKWLYLNFDKYKSLESAKEVMKALEESGVLETKAKISFLTNASSLSTILKEADKNNSFSEEDIELFFNSEIGKLLGDKEEFIEKSYAEQKSIIIDTYDTELDYIKRNKEEYKKNTEEANKNIKDKREGINTQIGELKDERTKINQKYNKRQEKYEEEYRKNFLESDNGYINKETGQFITYEEYNKQIAHAYKNEYEKRKKDIENYNGNDFKQLEDKSGYYNNKTGEFISNEEYQQKAENKLFVEEYENYSKNIIDINNQILELENQLKDLNNYNDDYTVDLEGINEELRTYYNLIGEYEAEEYGVDLEEFKTYRELLANNNNNLKENVEILNEVALANKRMEKAFKDVSGSWEEYDEIMSDSNSDLVDIANTINSMKDPLKNILNLDDYEFNLLSPDFIQKNWDIIRDVINNVEGAFGELKEKAGEEILLSVGATVDLDKDNKLDAEIADLQSKISSYDDIGFEIGVSIDDKDFINICNEMIQKAGMTADDIKRYFKEMGYNVELEPVETQVSSEFIAQEIRNGKSAYEAVSTYQNKVKAYALKVITPNGSYGGTTQVKSDVGSSGKSGGGKDKKKETKDKKKFNDEFDRFYPIKKKISDLSDSISDLDKQQSHLFGGALIGSLQQENALLSQQTDNYRELLRQQKEYAGELQGELSQFGMLFDSTTGNIANYHQVTQQALDEYNAAIEAYNNSAQEEADKEALKNAEERYNLFKGLMGKYQGILTDMIDTENQLDDLLYKQIENNLKAFEVKVELELDMAQAKRDVADFFNTINKNFRAVYQTTNDWLREFDTLSDKMSSFEYGTIPADLEKINEARKVADNDNYVADENSLFASQTEAINYLIEADQTLMKDAESVYDLYKQSWDTYLNAMDESIDQWNDLIDRFDDIDATLDHYEKISELLYGTDTKKGREDLDALYDARSNNNFGQEEALRASIDAMVKEKNELLAAGAKETDQDIKKLTEAIADSENKLLSVIEDHIDTLQNKYKNIVDITMDQMTENIWGNSMSNIREEWEDAQKLAEGYYDDVQRIYELETMESKWEAAINSTSSLQHQQELTALMERQLANLEEKTFLSEKDIELAEKELEVYKAQMALEDAQNNKTTMKLTRGTDGNWSYEYVADTDDVADKQQNYLDKVNEWRNASLNAYNDITENVMSAYEKYIERYTELMYDTTLSEEERAERMDYLNSYYWGEEGLITRAVEDSNYVQQLANEATFIELGSLYIADEENFGLMTAEEQRLIDELRDNGIMSYQALRNVVIDEIYPAILETAIEVNKSTVGSWNTMASSVVDMMYKNEDSVKNQISKAYAEMTSALNVYKDNVIAMEQVTGVKFTDTKNKITAIKTETANAKTEIQNLENTTDKLSDYYTKVEGMKTRWENVKKEITSTIEELDKYYQKLQNPPAAASPSTSGSTPSGGGNGGNTPSGGNNGNNGGNDNQSSINTSVQTYTYGNNILGVAVTNKVESTAKTDANKKVDDILSKAQGNGMPSTIASQIKDQTKKYDTGGYTGDWAGGEGRLAMLHSKELVLNAEDTANMLTAVSAIRDMASVSGSISGAIAAGISNMVMELTGLSSNKSSNINNSSSDNNIFNITAEFPNANDVNSIKEAILSLPTLASQYLSRD